MDNNFKFSTSVLALPLFFVLFLWLIFWIEIRFHFNFSNFGILPRTFSGLTGIIVSPFLHANLKHLVNNSISILILLVALRFFYREQAYKVIVFGILFSGTITWLIGRSNYHIGASGLIYVFISFMFFKGIFTKYYRLVALSLTIVVWYGSSVWYLFPSADTSMSWEGHLAGFISGFFLALYLKSVEYQKPILYDWQKPDFNPDEDDFIKNFDENGNFRDGSVQVDAETLELHDKNIVNEKQYIYHYKKNLQS